MAAYVKYEVFVEDLLKEVHNFTTDTFKIALTNTAPDAAADEDLADISELATGGGYTGGGNQTTIALTRTNGVAKVVGTDPAVWTGTGAGFTFRYAVLYNDTAATDPLIAYWDNGSSQLVSNGAALEIEFDGTNGLFTLT